MHAATASQFQGPVLVPTVPRSGGLVLPGVPSRAWTVASFLVSDAAALAATWMCLSGVDLIVPGERLVRASSFLPVIILLEICYAAVHMVGDVILHPAADMRRTARVTTLVYASFGIPLLTLGAAQPLILLATAWGATVVFVTLARIGLRMVCGQADWWGYPCVVLGRERAGRAILKTLNRWPELGLKPVVLLDSTEMEREIGGVPVHRNMEYAPVLARRYKIPYLIVAMPEMPPRQLQKLVGRYAKFFERVLVVPAAAESQPLWTTAGSAIGIRGYDVQHNGRKHAMRSAKAMSDYVCALLAVVFLSPLLLAISILIKLDSSGPVLFRQLRIGKGGRVFSVLKFRSMYSDATVRLQDILGRDAELREEFQTFRKLRDDPRVTPVGRMLRRYSLDELPQLWNVLRGEMSLVGPRAYLFEELACMGDMESVILQNPPGITGLWQVSGRNHLSFEDRVTLDVHYVQNWNFWLDAYIMARSIPVIVKGEGAY
ncbi:MAG TPA: undecaprenyl-phosphate galactose phosphotransferase WbaP [Rhodothermales bacterium]|nr:undecaprenyl-phosphate galactose phosphotransferase WbaP [Rhodothermales bacterium]